jgi:predicted phosphodiesterase
LHLGNDIVLRSIVRHRSWRKRTSSNLTLGLRDAIRKLDPDYIVITGDFVNKPCDSTFKHAAEYLRELLTGSGFNFQTRLLVIPGNHDVSFFPKKHEDDSRLRLYRNFLQMLFKESDTDTRKVREISVDTNHAAIFATLDSTLKSLVVTGAEGEIGISQRRWLETEIDKLNKLNVACKKYVKIALIHHHCIAIAGTPPSSEKFMQLLDAGDVLKTLDTLGFSVVLHGHKHFPHVTTHQRSDSSLMTVVGAGTTTCCFLEEQQQCGNNFNLLTLSAALNELKVQLYKADGNGEFSPSGQLQQFPLFRPEPLGYMSRRIRKTVDVGWDGTKAITILREGIRIQKPGKVMSSIPFQISSDTLNGIIEDFEYDPTFVIAHFEPGNGKILRGNFEFRQQLIYGSRPIDISYSFRIKKGSAMCQSDLPNFYADGRDTEATSTIVTNPMEIWELEINFPPKYPAVPEVRVEHMGVTVPLEVSARHDKALNRWKFQTADPPMDHRIHVQWRLPDKWP